MSTRNLIEGDGWRVGWNCASTEFQALVGSDTWAMELTAAEFEDFCRLSQQLADTMATMANELMDGERIACGQETELVWLEAEGFPHQFDLRLMLLTGRCGEGNWPAAAVTGLLKGLVELRQQLY